MKLLIALSLLPSLLAGEFWNDKKSGEWTPEERALLLAQSPWSKTVKAKLDFSRADAGPSLAQAMGGAPGGYIIGRQIGGPPKDLPKMQSVVRWESAAPIREASKQPLPEEAAGFLTISVTMTGMLAVPEGAAAGGDDAKDAQLRSTSLQAKGKMGMNPELMLRDAKTGTVYFLFPAKGVSAGDKEWEFESSVGTVEIKVKFLAKEMRYHGKTAI